MKLWHLCFPLSLIGLFLFGFLNWKRQGCQVSTRLKAKGYASWRLNCLYGAFCLDYFLLMYESQDAIISWFTKGDWEDCPRPVSILIWLAVFLAVATCIRYIGGPLVDIGYAVGRYYTRRDASIQCELCRRQGAYRSLAKCQWSVSACPCGYERAFMILGHPHAFDRIVKQEDVGDLAYLSHPSRPRERSKLLDAPSSPSDLPVEVFTVPMVKSLYFRSTAQQRRSRAHGHRRLEHEPSSAI